MTADAAAPTLGVKCRYMIRVGCPVRPAADFSRGGDEAGGATACLPRRLHAGPLQPVVSIVRKVSDDLSGACFEAWSCQDAQTASARQGRIKGRFEPASCCLMSPCLAPGAEQGRAGAMLSKSVNLTR